jgi:anti-sigma regulatory factor (Ser/Thr protein kinase)
MRKITLSNLENHMSLFDDNNTQFNSISWVEPIFIGMIRAYQKDKELNIQTDNSYIKNMILQNYTTNNTFSPIENIKNSRMGLEKISTHLTNIMLKNFTSLEENDIRDLKHYLQYLFLELMNNVADHAHSPVGGYTMAQYYPKEKKIQFTVSDRGVAFLENIQLNFSDIDNEEKAIFKALEKGVTSTQQKMYGQPKNAGFGLYAMFEILKMTGGSFVIISNDTLIRYENEKYTTKQLKTSWKGVVVAFEFFEANINHDMDYFKKNILWKLDEEDDDFF